jgi:CBS domain-containing protein
MSVATIIADKGDNVVTAGSSVSISELARLLNEHRIGAVVIVDGTGRPEGILSERDVVSAIARHGAAALDKPVGDYMSRTLFTCEREAPILEIMHIMTRNRVRHVPVLMEGRLGGIVSIGDVVKSRIAEIEFEADEMKRYIAG